MYKAAAHPPTGDIRIAPTGVSCREFSYSACRGCRSLSFSTSLTLPPRLRLSGRGGARRLRSLGVFAAVIECFQGEMVTMGTVFTS